MKHEAAELVDKLSHIRLVNSSDKMGGLPYGIPLSMDKVMTFVDEKSRVLSRLINDPNNYTRVAKKKGYTIWGCKPPMGTKVYNFLENKTYTVSEKTPWVLYGTQGEMWLVKDAKIASGYEPYKGNPNEEWVALTPTTTETLWCCFVPKDTPFVVYGWGDPYFGNRLGIQHGKGDFIVCGDDNGKPDFAKACNKVSRPIYEGSRRMEIDHITVDPNADTRWVVNGDVFGVTYNNKDFKDYLNTNLFEGNTPKPEVPVTEEGFYNYLMFWQNFYEPLNNCLLSGNVQLDYRIMPESNFVYNRLRPEYEFAHGCFSYDKTCKLYRWYEDVNKKILLRDANCIAITNLSQHMYRFKLTQWGIELQRKNDGVMALIPLKIVSSAGSVIELAQHIWKDESVETIATALNLQTKKVNRRTVTYTSDAVSD